MGKVVAYRVSLNGGWDRGRRDGGSFGVTLNLDTPESLILALAMGIRAEADGMVMTCKSTLVWLRAGTARRK